jgi:DNA polymerase III psi subunit
VELFPFDLEPGTSYFISILNQRDEEWVWMWTADREGLTPTGTRVGESGMWNPLDTHDLAFRLWQ